MFTHNAVFTFVRLFVAALGLLVLAVGQASAQNSQPLSMMPQPPDFPYQPVPPPQLAPCSDLFDTRQGGFYFANASGIDGEATFILVSNSSGYRIPLRVHVLRDDGTCYWADTYSEIGTSPLTIPMHGELGALGQPTSVKVFPLYPSDQQYLAASKSSYSGPGYRAMTSVKGVEFLTNRVYFAEGNTGGQFKETVTVFNTADLPVFLQFEFTDESGNIFRRHKDKDGNQLAIPTGPGRRTFDISGDLLKGLSFAHSINILAYYGQDYGPIGGPAIVAERKIVWGNGTEAHAEAGQFLHNIWFGAEGSKGGKFNTYLLINNPNDRDAQVEIGFHYEGGEIRLLNKTVPAKARATVDLSAEKGLPDGNFSYIAHSVNADPIVVERAMYWGFKNGTWEGGHVSAGSPAIGNRWHFAEGNAGGPYHPFLLLYNPGLEPNPALLTFRTETGEVIYHIEVIVAVLTTFE